MLLFFHILSHFFKHFFHLSFLLPSISFSVSLPLAPSLLIILTYPLHFNHRAIPPCFPSSFNAFLYLSFSVCNDPECSALEVSGSRSLTLPDSVFDVFSSCLSSNWLTFYSSGPQGSRYIYLIKSGNIQRTHTPH